MWFLLELLTEPESQLSAHYWASVLLAHAMLGVVLAAVFSWLGSKKAVLTISLAYAFFEMSHIVQGGEVVDSLVDWMAVLCGATIAVALWRNMIVPALVSMSVMGLLLWRGIDRRKPVLPPDQTRGETDEH